MGEGEREETGVERGGGRRVEGRGGVSGLSQSYGSKGI